MFDGMKVKNESGRLARLVRLDQVESLELVAAKTGVPPEKLARRWQSSSRTEARHASGRWRKEIAHPKGTVPRSAGS